ncbi:hypothetical protein PBNK5_29300 [Pectobacterium brasiliense]|nr:hypothetical protein Pcaca05_37210 [Pectobacterium carotovorum subsp. carotovorum]
MFNKDMKFSGDNAHKVVCNCTIIGDIISSYGRNCLMTNGVTTLIIENKTAFFFN